MDSLIIGICKQMIQKSVGMAINNIALKSIGGEEYLVFDMENALGEQIIKEVKLSDEYPNILPRNAEPTNVPVGTIWVVTA